MATQKTHLILWNDGEFVKRAASEWFNVVTTQNRNEATRYTHDRAVKLATEWNEQYVAEYKQPAPYHTMPVVQFENDRIEVRKASKHHRWCNANPEHNEHLPEQAQDREYYEVEVNNTITVLCKDCLHALWELVGIELGEL